MEIHSKFGVLKAIPMEVQTIEDSVSENEENIDTE